MSKPRICFFTNHFISQDGFGGAEVQAFLTAKHFISKGWEVYYIAKTFNKSGNFQDNYKGIRVQWIQPKYYFDFLDFRKLKKILNDISPDVIYHRNVSAYTGIISHWSCKHKKVFVWVNANNYNCRKNKISRLSWKKSQKQAYPRWKKYSLLTLAKIKDLLYVYGIRKADHIIVQNEHQKRMVKKIFNRESTIISPGHVVPSDNDLEKKEKIVAWIGNLHPRKKPEIFVKLAAKCRDLSNYRFVMAGAWNERFDQTALRDEIKSTDNLEYQGQISFEASNQLLERASLLVNTSLPNREGFPNTYIQSWLRFTPTICLHFDPDNVIEKHNLGRKSGNFKQLVMDTRFFLQHPDIREQVGFNCRRYAEEKHNIARNADNLELLLINLLQQKEKGR